MSTTEDSSVTPNANVNIQKSPLIKMLSDSPTFEKKPNRFTRSLNKQGRGVNGILSTEIPPPPTFVPFEHPNGYKVTNTGHNLSNRSSEECSNGHVSNNQAVNGDILFNDIASQILSALTSSHVEGELNILGQGGFITSHFSLSK